MNNCEKSRSNFIPIPWYIYLTLTLNVNNILFHVIKRKQNLYVFYIFHAKKYSCLIVTLQIYYIHDFWHSEWHSAMFYFVRISYCYQYKKGKCSNGRDTFSSRNAKSHKTHNVALVLNMSRSFINARDIYLFLASRSSNSAQRWVQDSYGRLEKPRRKNFMRVPRASVL